MSVLNQLFNRGLLGPKCKTCLNLAIARIKLLQNKRQVHLYQMRKEIAQFLQTGQEAIARIRVEHVVREMNMQAAYEILELFCEFVYARVPILESQNIVVMEGNPHPGATKGRMSFQSFNPSIDELNEAAANPDQPKSSATSNGDVETSERENGSSSLGVEDSNRSPGSGSSDHKRKQPEDVIETPCSNKSSRNMNGVGEQQYSNDRNGSRKHQKRGKHGKVDWSVLRLPKVHSREG